MVPFMEVLFLTVCTFLFFASLPYSVLSLYYVCYLYRSLIACRFCIYLLPVFLFVRALIVRDGTVVYSVSEGDIGYHPRPRKHWIAIRELPVASCTEEINNCFQIKWREVRYRYGTRTALKCATTPPCYHTPYYYRYHTPWYNICLECGSETPLQQVLYHTPY